MAVLRMAGFNVRSRYGSSGVVEDMKLLRWRTASNQSLRCYGSVRFCVYRVRRSTSVVVALTSLFAYFCPSVRPSVRTPVCPVRPPVHVIVVMEITRRSPDTRVRWEYRDLTGSRVMRSTQRMSEILKTSFDRESCASDN